LRTSSERNGHQNGHQHGTTVRDRTGRNGTTGRFSQYQSTHVGKEQNGTGRPPTNFESGAFNHPATFGWLQGEQFGCLRPSSCAVDKRWDHRWSGSLKRESYNDINGVRRTLPPPRTKKLLYLAFLSFSSYEFLRTFRDFAAHLATSPHRLTGLLWHLMLPRPVCAENLVRLMW
jgi:hypothetical protein